MAGIDPPWRLDPFQNIVGVGWAPRATPPRLTDLVGAWGAGGGTSGTFRFTDYSGTADVLEGELPEPPYTFVWDAFAAASVFASLDTPFGHGAFRLDNASGLVNLPPEVYHFFPFDTNDYNCDLSFGGVIRADVAAYSISSATLFSIYALGLPPIGVLTGLGVYGLMSGKSHVGVSAEVALPATVTDWTSAPGGKFWVATWNLNGTTIERQGESGGFGSINYKFVNVVLSSSHP